VAISILILPFYRLEREKKKKPQKADPARAGVQIKICLMSKPCFLPGSSKEGSIKYLGLGAGGSCL
jgi:hypothetical protein